MAVPKPPQPGASVTVKYNIGSAAGVVTRVVQSQVYVCFEGDAAESSRGRKSSSTAERRISVREK